MKQEEFEYIIRRVLDSKKLTRKVREEVENLIKIEKMTNPLQWCYDKGFKDGIDKDG